MTNIYSWNNGYDVATLLIACIVVAGVRVLKKTLLKNHLQNPFLPYLPFVLGVIVYAVYYCILALTLNGFLTHAQTVVREGVTVGCFSTVISSFLDKLTGETGLSGRALIVRSLLQGFVPDGQIEACAVRVAGCFDGGYGEEEQTAAARAIGEALASGGEECETEDTLALARLIAMTLQKTEKSAKT